MRQEKRTKVRLEFIYELEKRWDRQEKGTKVSLELIYDVEKGCQLSISGQRCPGLEEDLAGLTKKVHPLYRVLIISFVA